MRLSKKKVERNTKKQLQRQTKETKQSLEIDSENNADVQIIQII